MTAGVETDPLTLIFSAVGTALSVLAGIVLHLVSDKAKAVEKRVNSLESELRTFWQQVRDANQSQLVDAARMGGRVSALEASLAAFERNALTRELFEERTTSQDRALDQLERKVERVGRDLVARPTRSEMSFPAVRSTVPRVEPVESEPPPMRPRANSIRREDR